jgi:hypothetical protein
MLIAARGATDDAGGNPTPYGLDVSLSGRDRYDEDSRSISSVRLLFPAVECFADPEAVVARFRRYAELGSFAAGGCGLELVMRDSSQLVSWWSAELVGGRTLQPLGFEHDPMRDLAPGSPGATWLTLLGPGLVADLGLTGPSTLEGPTVMTVASGLCLRAAVYPPLGLSPDDVGTLPTVARLLRPRRLDRPAEHYGRFDNLPDGPYRNQPPRGW